MEIGGWASQNWFNLFSAIGIMAGLSFTTYSLRSETKTRQIANLLTITANHREIWKEFLNNPKLARIRDASADNDLCSSHAATAPPFEPFASLSRQNALQFESRSTKA
jgi:hypothetical protein